NKFIAKSDYWNMNIKDSIASVQIFNFPDLTYYKTLITKSYLSISQLAFSDINQYLAGALGSDGDKIWNTSDWGLFRNFNQGEDQYSFKFSKDNNFLITGGGLIYNVKIWNLISGNLIYTYPECNIPKMIDVSPDEKYIALAHATSGIIVYNAKWNPISVTDNPVQITNPIIFPNPTNGNANIQFNLLKPEIANIQIYDSLSNLVSSVNNGLLQQGMQNIPWNASLVASGVYFARISAAGQVSTIQIIVNK
ncbi:MAG: T9SS type A sorting domain-containing protein, partial [Candidatus Kapabacteria bacterium]|nr:T9SS type A sorting domain-containing protein [Candidatus Kapabacteria bacterium]